MAHILPPRQCSANIPTWTDATLTANVSDIRKIHIDELRTQVNAEFTRRFKAVATWTDPVITSHLTDVRAVHINELRNEMGNCKIGRGELNYCVQDTSGCMDFNDNPVVAKVTDIKPALHIAQMRTRAQSLMTTCICEIEQCQYCADCGYYYSYCSHNGVACADHKYAEGCGHTVYAYNCGSINLALLTAHPYKSWNGTTGVSWDGYVPWDMCMYTPPGALWTKYNPPRTPGKNHSDWNCMCNPYTWTT